MPFELFEPLQTGEVSSFGKEADTERNRHFNITPLGRSPTSLASLSSRKSEDYHLRAITLGHLVILQFSFALTDGRFRFSQSLATIRSGHSESCTAYETYMACFSRLVFPIIRATFLRTGRTWFVFLSYDYFDWRSR
jgi:hypothetical protein